MGERITELDFDDWMRFYFDHPEADRDWFWDIDRDELALQEGCEIGYATKLFNGAGDLLAPYSDKQVDNGLWHFVGNTHELNSLGDGRIALDERLACVEAIRVLYEQLFLLRCTPHLSHLDEAGVGALNSVCYMWWDIFPLSGRPRERDRQEIDAALMGVMEGALKLASVACQESALHGLGHWEHYHTERCGRIVADYLAGNTSLRPELREYAKRAAAGMVQ